MLELVRMRQDANVAEQTPRFFSIRLATEMLLPKGRVGNRGEPRVVREGTAGAPRGNRGGACFGNPSFF